MLTETEILIGYFAVGCFFALLLMIIVGGIILIIRYWRQLKRLKKEQKELIDDLNK